MDCKNMGKCGKVCEENEAVHQLFMDCKNMGKCGKIWEDNEAMHGLQEYGKMWENMRRK